MPRSSNDRCPFECASSHLIARSHMYMYSFDTVDVDVCKLDRARLAIARTQAEFEASKSMRAKRIKS